MPKRDDIRSVLVIGSGPIVIGQACEFDYSGTQACRVLRDEGVRVILINSNPATIMTDPDFADATYVEPITWEVIETIIAKERPDAILATLGGQTALNAAVELHEHGVLEKYGVELIGANLEAIRKGEDRQLFKELVLLAGAEVARSHIAHTVDEAIGFAEDLGYPLVIRPSFTMGGLGSGFAHDRNELIRMVGDGLHQSPTSEVLLEESILGWKEYELELMRDTSDNTVVVCSIENVDPVGVHTGDSITVAPALTLTDREFQRLRAELAHRVGHPISDGAIRSSIGLYNKKRRLMRDLYQIRCDEPWRLSCSESYMLVRAGTRISCEQHIELLEEALDAIRHRHVVAQDKPRVIFVGGFCEQPPLEMIEAMDDNCFIVDDDLLIGQRWVKEDVPEDAGDPVWALAESYIERSNASPVQHDRRKPKEVYMMDMMRAAKADAAILAAAKFCEPGLDDQLFWSKDLDEAGIQYLVLEFEEKMTSFEQMSMQLETFAESLLFALA